VFARVEVGTRTARDLVITAVPADTIYRVGAYSIGALHDLTRNASAVNIGIGAQVTLGSKDAGLNSHYGSGTPRGYQVFFRIRPPDMARSMGSMAGMSGMQH
jgi:hypothetical protein